VPKRSENCPRLLEEVRGHYVLENIMAKYQKPLRSAFAELIDVDFDHTKRTELLEAYSEFWETLEEEDREELDSMLS
jgi:hypothetical protein